MSQTDQELIVLGPGGLILDDKPQNQGLLGQLKEEPALQPNELLKLADYFKAYPTGVPLGNHLALLALATQEGEPVSQKVFPEYVEYYNDTSEDIKDGAVEKKERTDDLVVRLFARNEDEVQGITPVIDLRIKKGKPELDRRLHLALDAQVLRVARDPDVVRLSVHWVPVSGIGLLIETLDIEADPGAMSLNQVIGVSPEPRSLLDA